VVILPRGKISTAQLVQPLANGALVLALDTDFDGCMAIVQRAGRGRRVYLANSMNSLRLEGQKTVAMELVQQLGWTVPDWVVIPGGNLGNVSRRSAAGFRTMIELGMIDRAPRICVAQAANASPLYQAYQRGFADFAPVRGPDHAGLGDPDRQPGQLAEGGARARATPTAWSPPPARPSWPTPRRRADRHGLFTCPHTGVALAALEQLAAARHDRRADRAWSSCRPPAA
jgi:threonine synthase